MPNLLLVAAAAALIVAAIPVARVLARPPVWVEASRRPLVSTVLALSVAAIAVALARTSASWPWIWAVLAGIAILSAGVAYLRARPGWGRARGLPPGSLGLVASLDAIIDRGFYAAQARRYGPVFKMAQFHRPVVCITDLPLGLRVLNEQAARMIQPRLPFGRLSPGNYIEFMNDERHARYRGILKPALSGRVVRACRGGVSDVVRKRLLDMSESGVGKGVSPGPFLDSLAFAAMLRVVLGVAVDDDRFPEIESWFRDLGTVRAFTERRPEERVEPFGRLVEWAREAGRTLLASADAGEPPVDSALQEILRSDPRHLDDDTVLGNLILIVHVTHSNIRGLLGWVLKEYVDHPRFEDLLREASSGENVRHRSEVAATQFVNEVLRRNQSEYFYREVVEQVEIGNWKAPPGWLLRVCVREAHDDPHVFPEPHLFRPERFADRTYDKTEYCPFSDGAHSCFGAGLALMIAKVFLLELARGFDVRVVADGPVERAGNRHWGHWQPSGSLRVALSPVPQGAAGL